MKMCGIGQLLDAALTGFNVTIFVYGQTGSGKTFTMSGRDDAATEDSPTGLRIPYAYTLVRVAYVVVLYMGSRQGSASVRKSSLSC